MASRPDPLGGSEPSAARAARTPLAFVVVLAVVIPTASVLAYGVGAAELRLWIAVVTGALVLAVGVGAFVSWRLQLTALERSRVAADAERRSLARKLEHLMRHAREMVFVADEELRLVDVNERAAQALGYTREELIGMPARSLRDPSTAGDFDERVRRQIAMGAEIFETRYRRKDGTTFPVEATVHADVYEGRRWFQAIVRDLTDRKRAEEALRASEAKFRAAFEFASLGIVLLDREGRVVETNRAFRDLTGHGEDESRGLRLQTLHDPPDGEPPGQDLDRLLRGEIERVELAWRLRRRDGSLAEVTVRASALRDEEGAFRLALAVLEDVSEKKRIEAQLFLADRMVSVGTLAAGVAHEINNPLSFILSNLEFAVGELRGRGGDPEVQHALVDARDGAVRVREIVRDLKTFSRPVDEAREPLDVRRVLQSAVGLASNELRHRALVVVDPGEVPRVLASESRLAQVLVNLLINAAQAIPEGNVTGNVVRAATGTAPDGRAMVEISDTGCGIPEALLPRVFDPFFTTKPVGVGTGLGLSICHAIVTQLDGEIAVESEPGRGSTFRVLLPPAPSRAERAAAAPPRRPSRRGRILVVDDEALVGRAVNRILTPLHEVVARTSARAALDELLSSPGPFDVVLCDLMMPEMTGMELHAKVRTAAPALAERIVFLTGGAFTPAAREFLERVPNPCLEKPFAPDALRDVVARLLDGASERRG